MALELVFHMIIVFTGAIVQNLASLSAKKQIIGLEHFLNFAPDVVMKSSKTSSDMFVVEVCRFDGQ